MSLIAFMVFAEERPQSPNDPKLSDPALEGGRLQPAAKGRVRCSA